MRIHQFRDFIAIAESGSLRMAATRLGMTQPALTKRIRSLEEEVGVPLFSRSTLGVKLTQYGEALLPRARHIASELAHALDELDDMRTGGAKGAVTVAVAPVAAVRIMPAAIRAFRSRGHDSLITLTSGLHPPGVAQLRAGSVDLYVGPILNGDAGADLSIEPLCDNPLVVVCRNGHPLASSRSLAELTRAQWVFGGASGLRGAFYHDMFREYGLPVPKTETQCQSMLALLCLVAESDLLTMMPASVLNKDYLRGAFQVLALREKIQLPSVNLVTRSGVPQSKAAAAMSSAIRLAVR